MMRNLQRPFRLTMIATGQFFLLTILAMFLYRGGTLHDPRSPGYAFFRNFFSDLGLTQAHSGAPNLPSAALFCVALTGAGLGLIIYFVTAPRLFDGRFDRPLSWLGSLFGVVAGLSYIGVAFTPANLYGDAHLDFVYAAFISFLAAALCYAGALLVNGRFPRRYGLIFLTFAGLLGLYVRLLFAGPGLGTPDGVLVQATGQKIIAYAAILTMFIQGYGGWRLAAVDRAASPMLE